MRTEKEKQGAEAYRSEVRDKLSNHLSSGGKWLATPEEHAMLLREVGTPEELAEQVQCAARVLANVHRALLADDEERQVYAAFALLGSRLEELRDLASQSELELDARGHHYARTERRLEEKPKGRGRPKHSTKEEIIALFERFRIEYEDKAGTVNSQAVREKIRASMQHRYPPEMLTTERGGAIWRAINEYLYRGYR